MLDDNDLLVLFSRFFLNRKTLRKEYKEKEIRMAVLSFMMMMMIVKSI
jgi:hypothetical protein